MKRLTETTTEAIEGEFIAADEWETKDLEKEFRDANEQQERLAAILKQQRAEHEFRQKAGAFSALGGGIGGMGPCGDWLDKAGASWVQRFGR